MKERPIIFSGEMVRAILEGRKTQTRRVVKHRYGIEFLGGRGDENDPSCWGYWFDGPRQNGYMVLARGLNERHNHGLISLPCPYGQPGDRLYVKETHAFNAPIDVSPTGVVYRADEARIWSAWKPKRWRPSIHMPRWASRITLEVVSVRVERLQDISEEDARAEGGGNGCYSTTFEPCTPGERCRKCGRPSSNVGPSAHTEAFARLWDRINAKRAPWASNPWVWAVEFKAVQP